MWKYFWHRILREKAVLLHLKHWTLWFFLYSRGRPGSRAAVPPTIPWWILHIRLMLAILPTIPILPPPPPTTPIRELYPRPTACKATPTPCTTALRTRPTTVTTRAPTRCIRPARETVCAILSVALRAAYRPAAMEAPILCTVHRVAGWHAAD